MLAIACFVATGCSSGGSATQTVSGWFGSDSKSTEKVLYARVAGLAVHAEPSSSSRQVGRLGAAERVVRSKEKNGFAYIRARGGSLQGWVAGSKLTSRRPAKSPGGAAPDPGAETGSPTEAESSAETEAAAETTVGATADATAEPAVESPAPAAPNPPPAPEPSAPARPKGVGASVFDPY